MIKYILFILSTIFLITSCSEENFDDTKTEEVEFSIDTTIVNSGELMFDYNGSTNTLFDATGYACLIFDTLADTTYTDYIITNGEFLENENLIRLTDEDFVISYQSKVDFLNISFYISNDDRIIRSIYTPLSEITIEESGDTISGTWTALFESSSAQDLVNWEVVGVLEGSFKVPKMEFCE